MAKNIIYRLIAFFILLNSSVALSQSSTHPQSNYSIKEKLNKLPFGSPVDIPLYLSGTFGELRSNHFHSGIDIKTEGVEGKIIRAIEDGWVSRIKISTGGYGKALYITHPNGYVSVYGHLQKFNDTIQKLVINEQYLKESFTIQIFPEKEEINVEKGDIIAYSGNTGGSEGPHLHFEIREELSQYPVNPLLCESIKIKDYYRPKITQLVIYPVDNNSLINGSHDTVFYDIEGWGIEHRIKGNPEITLAGRISFGIGTYDLMNEVSNKNGVYCTKLYHDTTLIYDLNMNKLSFNTTRYINSLIDYSFFIRSKKRIIRTEVDTNNMLFNYLTVINNGIIDFNDSLTHNMVFEVKDAYENTSKLSFNVVGSSKLSKSDSVFREKITTGSFFDFARKNSIINDKIKVNFPANSFYRSYFFNFAEMEKDSISYSSTYRLHNRFTPVHKYFTISILADSVVPGLYEKMYISYSPDNTEFFYINTITDGDYLTGRSRELGYYKVLLDTTPPIITEVNFHDAKKLVKQHNLKIKIKDDETSIHSYKASLNDKWILMEYDPKKELLIYNFDEMLQKGKNEFKLIVNDMLDNESEYKCVLIY